MTTLNKVTFSCYIFLITATLSCKKEKQYTSEKIAGKEISIDPDIPLDQEISEFIAPYKKAIAKEMDSILAYSPKSLSKKDGDYNTAIGNFMADAVLELANPIFTKRTGYPFDAVLLNAGGIRSTLNEGPVTTRTAYNLMPFENEIVVVELSGLQIKEMLDYLESGAAHPIAGMQITLGSDDKVSAATINGKEIRDNETYFIATSDYLQNGGDNMTFLTKPVSKMQLDYKIRNILIDYFKKYDTINPVRDNRFIKVN